MDKGKRNKSMAVSMEDRDVSIIEEKTNKKTGGYSTF